MSRLESAGDTNSKSPSFWKKNAKNVPGNMKPVYGAQHPPISQVPSGHMLPSTPKRLKDPNQKDAFRDFEADTCDAWDDGEDDLMAMAGTKLSIKDVQLTAMQVMDAHSKQMKVEENLTHKPATNNQLASAPPPNTDKPAFIRLQENRIANNTNHTVTESSPQLSPAATTESGGPGTGVRMPQNCQRISTHGHGHTQIRHAKLTDREAAKMEKFETLLKDPSIELAELKNLCWSGIPWKYRPVTWKILSGYLPPISDRQDLTLQRKRLEYFNYVDQYYDTRHTEHQETYKQIQIDIPRMSPLIQIFQQEVVQHIFERILFIWAIRHPASGYVQGINDLVTPFFVVYLSEFLGDDIDLDKIVVSNVAEENLRKVEADAFWCVSKLLDSIQDNYTFAQPGIQLKVNALKELTSRINSELHHHLESQCVEYLQFSFRWMNNLLMREVPLRCTIRLWDTYMSEMSDFATFHLYVCAALLAKFSEDLLREKDFQGLMILLQNLPTHHWGNEEIGEMLADAFRLKYMFADAPRHLTSKAT